MTEALAMEFHSLGIRVSDVMPYFVYTGMTNDQNEEQFVSASKQTPGQIAKVIFKATKSRKRHHRVGFNPKLLYIASRLLPTKLTEFFLRKFLRVK